MKASYRQSSSPESRRGNIYFHVFEISFRLVTDLIAQKALSVSRRNTVRLSFSSQGENSERLTSGL